MVEALRGVIIALICGSANIYNAMAAGKMESGTLIAGYKLAGQMAHRFRELVDLGQEFRYQRPVVATTKRLRHREPELIGKVVAAYLQSIFLFKIAAARVVVPVLRRYLGVVRDEQAAEIQQFYAARFQDAPFASKEGIARVIQSFAKEYPDALKPRPEDVYNPFFLDAAIATSTQSA